MNLAPSLSAVLDLLSNGELDTFQLMKQLRLPYRAVAGRCQKLKVRGYIDAIGRRARANSSINGDRAEYMVWRLASRRITEVKPYNPRIAGRITIGRQVMQRWY